MKNLSLIAATLLSIALFSRDARSNCSIINVVGVAFGGYDVFSSYPLDSAGSITFNCTGLGEGTILIDLSRGGSSSFVPRRMSSGPASLDYNLYLDAARTALWGDGTSGTSHYGPVNPSENTNTTINVFGRAPARQNVPTGQYADTIVVTIQY